MSEKYEWSPSLKRSTAVETRFVRFVMRTWVMDAQLQSCLADTCSTRSASQSGWLEANCGVLCAIPVWCCLQRPRFRQKRLFGLLHDSSFIISRGCLRWQSYVSICLSSVREPLQLIWKFPVSARLVLVIFLSTACCFSGLTTSFSARAEEVSSARNSFGRA